MLFSVAWQSWNAVPQQFGFLVAKFNGSRDANWWYRYVPFPPHDPSRYMGQPVSRLDRLEQVRGPQQRHFVDRCFSINAANTMVTKMTSLPKMDGWNTIVSFLGDVKRRVFRGKLRTVGFRERNVMLLMEEILHQLVGSFSHLQGFIHPWLISSINSITWGSLLPRFLAWSRHCHPTGTSAPRGETKWFPPSALECCDLF